jgi:thiol-disulfide isomerase/thioredoxin
MTALTRIRSTAVRLLLAVTIVGAFGGAAPALAADEFPTDWYFYGEKRPQQLRALEGKPGPALTVENWQGEPQELAALKGKVVVVDFWGVWCRPCMASVPKNKKLVKKYGKKGFAFIGVHSTKAAQRMPSTVEKMKMNYPVAADVGNKSSKAWGVRFWPTYAVLDRKGVVRAIGIKPEHVEDVVKKLLAEPAPAGPQAP